VSAFFEQSLYQEADISGRNWNLTMPNNRSAEKRMRQEQKRRAHNRSVKSIVKTQVTKARVAIANPAVGAEDATAAVRAAVSELDRAAKKGVLHKNNAARRKSRLMRQLNAK
jgi:small subunit ribosomal protein S20